MCSAPHTYLAAVQVVARHSHLPCMKTYSSGPSHLNAAAASTRPVGMQQLTLIKPTCNHSQLAAKWPQPPQQLPTSGAEQPLSTARRQQLADAVAKPDGVAIAPAAAAQGHSVAVTQVCPGAAILQLQGPGAISRRLQQAAAAVRRLPTEDMSKPLPTFALYAARSATAVMCSTSGTFLNVGLPACRHSRRGTGSRCPAGPPAAGCSRPRCDAPPSAASSSTYKRKPLER